jgi:formate hydrogenlyase subunit 6/NADH:ubiquinone oxidoreductase subunit I
MLGELSKILFKRFKFAIQQPTATVEYPSVIKQAPQNSRVSLRNNFAECIGCHKCEEKCPTKCISITSEDYPSKEKAPRTSHGVIFEKRVTSFKIDFASCVNCGICVDVCPTNSLTNDKNFISPRQNEKHLVIDLVHRPRSLRREQGYEE